ncbi:sugar transferase (PEP-CTERM/EpsH1 system associated) [Oxalobacteraceae bacterium GrIS 1.11]
MQDLLFLAHRIPYPPNKGDKIRSYHLLKYLSGHFRVHLGCFIDDPADRQHLDSLRPLCASICGINQHPFAARLRSLKGLLYGQSMSLHYYRNGTLREWVEHLLGSGNIDCALAFSGPMAQYLQAAPTLRRVIDFVDVDSEKWLEYGAATDWPMSQLYRREARYLLDYEREVAQQFDGATFVSEAEASLFRQRAPSARHKVSFFNNGVDADYFSPHLAHANPYPPGRAALVFTGAMDYWPNVHAMQWFVWRVWPRLRRHFPALYFYIVGAKPTPQVTALARVPGVIVTGAVPDIRPYLAHAQLAVAPLRIARGVQNKVLEAMAMQKTVLASAQALEGISAVPGLEIELARDEAEFISQASRLLASPAQLEMELAARRRILQDYSWNHNLQELGSLFGLPRTAGRERREPVT